MIALARYENPPEPQPPRTAEALSSMSFGCQATQLRAWFQWEAQIINDRANRLETLSQSQTQQVMKMTAAVDALTARENRC